MSWRQAGMRRKARSRRYEDEVEVAEALDYDPIPTHVGRKKRGKRWCRGKEGRQHRYVKARVVKLFNHEVTVWRCELCGRQEWKR